MTLAYTKTSLYNANAAYYASKSPSLLDIQRSNCHLSKDREETVFVYAKTPIYTVNSALCA